MKRRLIHATILAVIALVVGLLLGQSGHVGHYRIPVLIHHNAPVPPGQVLPPTPKGVTPCSVTRGTLNHEMSQCLPKPKDARPNPPTPSSVPHTSSLGTMILAGHVAAIKGSDRSNNDPTSAWAAIRASGIRFTYLKVTEGTGFVDRTAPWQANLAYRNGIAVGGYDFAHVCDDAGVEARLFVAELKNAGLVPQKGKHILAPVLDVEYPFSTPCNGAAWVSAHRSEVHRLLHVWEDIYTGKWYWDPHIGCYWPAGARPWISGYGSLPVPCGSPRVAIWQYTDAGWDGANNIDLNDWLAGPGDLLRAQGGVAVPACCHEGNRGRDVWLETHRLAIAGWLSHAGTFYSHHVAQVVKAFQHRHHLSPATGVTGPRTWLAIKHAAELRKSHHLKERT